ncbi:MAG: LysE family transporter [Pseudomonadota bacterium]
MTPESLPWDAILVAWTVFAANVISPGPNVFNTIAIALGAGRAVALAVVPAIALGVLGWALAAVLGAAALFGRMPVFEPISACAGGALLILFAYRYAQRAIRWETTGGGRIRISASEAFWTTLSVLATNPKALTTWLVLVSLVPPSEASKATLIAMILGPVAIACMAHAAYATLFSTGIAARLYARAGRWILAGVAGFFCILGTGLLLRDGPRVATQLGWI